VAKAKVNLNALVALAQQYLGTPYVWGGSSPKTGFDCSGFVQWLYGQQGISLPRTTYQQYGKGIPIPKTELKPGDIVFFEGSAKGPGHEGLYIGNGKFIESPHTGAKIRISSLAGRRDFVGARRVIPGGQGFFGVVAAATSSATAPAARGATGVQQPASVLPNFGGSSLGAAEATGPQSLDPGSVPAQGFTPKLAQQLWQTLANQPNASPDVQAYAQQSSD
jgi:hypothetical protein